jgi:hypothetical protein
MRDKTGSGSCRMGDTGLSNVECKRARVSGLDSFGPGRV